MIGNIRVKTNRRGADYALITVYQQQITVQLFGQSPLFLHQRHYWLDVNPELATIYDPATRAWDATALDALANETSDSVAGKSIAFS